MESYELLLKVLTIDLTARAVFRWLSDDDLRFMYGVSTALKQIALEELQRRAGGRLAQLSYTTAVACHSFEVLRQQSRFLERCGAIHNRYPWDMGITFRHFHGDICASCVAGDPEVMLWITQKYKIYGYNMFIAACKHGRLDVAQMIYDHLSAEVIDSHTMVVSWPFVEAAENGHLDIVQWLQSVIPLPTHWQRHVRESVGRAFYGACGNGHLATAQWLHETFGLANTNAQADAAQSQACRSGHLAVAQWLHRIYGTTVESSDLSAICGNGHLAVARWACDTFGLSVKSMDVHAAFGEACKGGHLEMAKWIHVACDIQPELVKTLDSSLFREVCTNGHLDVAQWMHRTFSLTARDMEAGCWIYGSGDLDITCWLLHTFKWGAEVGVYLGFEEICEMGHLHMAKWLLRRNPGLADTITETGTHLYSFRCACDKGHLKLAQWLCDTFDMTTDEMHAQCMPIFLTLCEEGRLKTARQMHRALGISAEHVISSKCLYHTAKRGCLEVAQWLHEAFDLASVNHEQLDPQSVLEEALEHANYKMAYWLHRVYGVYCKLQPWQANRLKEHMQYYPELKENAWMRELLVGGWSASSREL